MMPLPTFEREKARFFFNPLRSRFLWIFVSTHMLLAIGLGRVFAFAPDESMYLQVFKTEYISGFSTASILGWSNSQTFFLRAIYLPAKSLSMLGVPDFLSIRIMAIVTSALAVYLLLCVFRFENHVRLPRLIQIILFTPSFFLWMTLGLRESFIYLSLSMVCAGFYLLGLANVRSGFSLLVSGNLIIFETKSYLFLLVGFSTCVYLAFHLVTNKKFQIIQSYIVLAMLIPMVVNPQGVKSVIESVKNTLASVSTTGQVGIAPVAQSNSLVASESGASTVTALKKMINSHPTNVIAKILSHTNLSHTYNTSRLNVSPAKVGTPITVVYRSAGFLFTPFPFIDNGSLFENVASYEFPFWWLLYGMTGFALWRRFRDKTFNGLVVFALTFSIVFVFFSAFTEINVGTMARHRSVLIFPLLYLLAMNLRRPVESPLLH